MRYVGLKQVQKSIKEKNAKKVYIAKDAESRITEELIKKCQDNNIPIVYVETMTELGKKAGIDVGASCMAE
ncbi:MAG: ribosomal L7Ae/L30e/S12e/Gadd45 family protein [Clostridia bacterium]|nr:ribosomal L7Ae/L30e/S12e/Gadd45 family protein [Clostridia bacterium]